MQGVPQDVEFTNLALVASLGQSLGEAPGKEVGRTWRE